MTRAIVVVVGALAAVAQADPHGAPPVPPPSAGNIGDRGCTSSPPADFERKRAAAVQARDQAFTRALAKKKLSASSGTVNVRALDEAGARARPRNNPGTIDLGSGVAYATPSVELVADARGTLYRVVRAPHSDGPAIRLCGCGPVTHGGAAPRFVRWVADLPPGAHFGGDVTIEYDDHVPSTSYTEWMGDRPCPQPP